MSRIGKAPISLPSGVEINVSKGNLVTVKGPKGELTQQIDPEMEIAVEDGEISVKRPTEQKRHRAMHGLSRSLVANMITGVTDGFVKELELVGVGYRAANTGQLLELTIGYSHPIMFALPDEVKVTTAMDKGKAPVVRLESHDKQLLGEVANKIRSYRKPEPYKGKGIRFAGEEVRRKAGKSASK
ncbi:50S ribosomal protein L6 [Phaeodactylibacter xiamenensis]|jgi:large subunit ribosomal protein L6|uniref:Large ribosomal subunit protein uL6 n=1 Tax=Phaeodactylibacter xiamenensis TaxID=1524460 RepID=A0A098S718_9BACT|nr:50S ribosomal protein L6 [Phaeodactylibacter xiamenensis]KGE87453.1 50S ribosomal protein L6 [Phaeodactylibacter xiamenensis]MCR9055144.1 50S ribosomal protein L6 [bacterium]